MKDIIPMIVAVICMLMAALIVVLGFLGTIEDLYKAWVSRNWPRVTGYLQSKTIEVKEHDGLSYHPKVNYKYDINGMTYYSTNIGYLGMHSLSEENAEELLGHLQVNKNLDVFYNPKDPEDAVLVTGLIRGHYMSLIFILGCSVILVELALEFIIDIVG